MFTVSLLLQVNRLGSSSAWRRVWHSIHNATEPFTHLSSVHSETTQGLDTRQNEKCLEQSRWDSTEGHTGHGSHLPIAWYREVSLEWFSSSTQSSFRGCGGEGQRGDSNLMHMPVKATRHRSLRPLLLFFGVHLEAMVISAGCSQAVGAGAPLQG